MTDLVPTAITRARDLERAACVRWLREHAAGYRASDQPTSAYHLEEKANQIERGEHHELFDADEVQSTDAEHLDAVREAEKTLRSIGMYVEAWEDGDHALHALGHIEELLRRIPQGSGEGPAESVSTAETAPSDQPSQPITSSTPAAAPEAGAFSDVRCSRCGGARLLKRGKPAQCSFLACPSPLYDYERETGTKAGGRPITVVDVSTPVPVTGFDVARDLPPGFFVPDPTGMKVTQTFSTGPKLVVIESPYAGEVEANVAYAKRAVVDCLERGESPYASHLFFTQPGLLDDRLPIERMAGINAGFAWGAKADLVVVYVDRGMSRGMEQGIARALAANQPIEFRSLDGADLSVYPPLATQAAIERLSGGGS